MKFSIIACYRNREEHLKVFVPHIRNHFKNVDHEIIVVEQDDEFPFRRGCLLNDGAKRATGDILVLHDVDYLPDANTAYWGDGAIDVYQPVKRVNFVNTDGTPRATEDIPSGYRHFSTAVDDNFYGAVTCLTRRVFFHINGFNPLYEGWGLEDADLRERIKLAKCVVVRGDGTFSALPHKDSFPGDDNEKFIQNTNLFNEWSKWTHYGVGNSFPAINENKDKAVQWGVDTWIESTAWAVCNDDMKPFFSIDGVSKYYEDTPQKHTTIWNAFKSIVNATPELKAHRDWVVQNRWGYGNRAFHWMWSLLVREAPKNFKFLEIGVFKGQITSLVSLLNKDLHKGGQIYGITPLNKDGDKYGTHPDDQYETRIAEIYGHFGLDASDLTLIEGYSQDAEIINIARDRAPFDLIFVDGCHDYDVVISDLRNYGELLRVGGYLIVDDSSSQLQIPDGLIRLNWRGLPEVTQAVEDVIVPDPRFVHLFAVGHNRVFKRIS